MNKPALVLILIFVTSSVMIESAFAQSIPKPSVPEFTLHLTEHPYDVLPLTATDPYTGNNITTRVGYQVQNMSAELIITNQPFTPYKNSNDTPISLYYNVNWKGHYENEWHTSLPHYPASNSSNTVLAFGLNIPEYANYPATKLGNFPIESQLDFRIEALIGYHAKITVNLTPNDTRSPLVVRDVFYGETSNWSNIHTVVIGQTSTSASPGLTPTPTQPIIPNPTKSTSTSTPIAPDINSDSTTVPLDASIIIVVMVGLLAVALSALLYTRHRRVSNASTV